MSGDATAGFQDVAGDGEFVGGCADISKRVMQDEVFEMNEFTVDPERGMRVEEMRALEKTLTDGRAGNALVETGKRDGCGFYFQISIRGMSYASWVLALNWRRFSANDFSEALCQSDFTIEVRRRRARSRTSTG